MRESLRRAGGSILAAHAVPSANTGESGGAAALRGREGREGALAGHWGGSRKEAAEVGRSLFGPEGFARLRVGNPWRRVRWFLWFSEGKECKWLLFLGPFNASGRGEALGPGEPEEDRTPTGPADREEQGHEEEEVGREAAGLLPPGAGS